MAKDLHTTVLMSGGIDSTACVAFLMAQGMRVSGLFIDHGQVAAKLEAAAVSGLAAVLGIQVRHLVLSGGEPRGAGELIGRNAFLIFTALFATRARTSAIAVGLHAGTPYYDCSPAFVELMSRSVAEHTDGKVRLAAPFIDWSKQDVYAYFVQSGLPIGLTYSCERGEFPSCGTCASCLDRRAIGC